MTIIEQNIVNAIDRLEMSPGPDRELDEALFQIAHGRRRFVSSFEQYDPSENLPSYTNSVDSALELLPSGFWWRGGTCHVSSEAVVCPDHNHPDHRERLLREYPPTKEHWNSGIEVEIRPGSDDALARALASACLRARLIRQGEETS